MYWYSQPTEVVKCNLDLVDHKLGEIEVYYACHSQWQTKQPQHLNLQVNSKETRGIESRTPEVQNSLEYPHDDLDPHSRYPYDTEDEEDLQNQDVQVYCKHLDKEAMEYVGSFARTINTLSKAIQRREIHQKRYRSL